MLPVLIALGQIKVKKFEELIDCVPEEHWTFDIQTFSLLSPDKSNQQCSASPNANPLFVASVHPQQF